MWKTWTENCVEDDIEVQIYNWVYENYTYIYYVKEYKAQVKRFRLVVNSELSHHVIMLLNQYSTCVSMPVKVQHDAKIY